MYEDKVGRLYIDVKEDCILNHTQLANITNLDIKKEYTVRDHRSTIVKKGMYLAGIQQRFDPFNGFKENVRD